MLICNVIAPNNGKTLFHASSYPGGEKDGTAEAEDVLKYLMTAYKNAKTNSTKTQILSLYAYKYSVIRLEKTSLAICRGGSRGGVEGVATPPPPPLRSICLLLFVFFFLN